jgi:protein O-GlcNAc transferase
MRLLVAQADSLNRTRGPKEAENIANACALARERLETPGDLLRDSRVLFGLFIRNADFDAAARLGSFEELGEHYATNNHYASLHLLLAQARTPRHRRLLIDWHRRCGDVMIEAARRAPLAPPAAPATVGRAKIRVGLMSSDLRDHPVGHFVQPLARHYDRDRFEFHAYSWSTQPADAPQRWFAGQFDQFRHKAPVSERDAAQLIADDALDVLFDLGGSTDMNKLGALAWRPAPRIASWLGFPHSAGLGTIDRILVDPYLQPTDPALLVEKPLRLAHSWVVVDPIAGAARPAITPLAPSRRTGRITFGTMNNPCKYNPELFATWAEILRRTPGSRFLFVRPEGAVESFRANIGSLFESHGVARERIFFTPVRGLHLPHYNDIDVALDTFPQTGGTTTCETLWMGTPLVSRVGEGFFERLSYSNLANLGLCEFVAATRDDYVGLSIAIAQDEDRRQHLRATMRERFKAHPIGDGRGFARDFEQAVAAWMDEGRP